MRDEEHDLGARISLERGARVAPFAITCGIYGWMLHTCFLGSQEEAEAQYETMKTALAAILLAAKLSAQFDGSQKVLMAGVRSFVEMFP